MKPILRRIALIKILSLIPEISDIQRTIYYQVSQLILQYLIRLYRVFPVDEIRLILLVSIV